jgi:hypothetical protein
MKYIASQILNQKGINVDLDGVRLAQEFDKDDSEIIKRESGNLPAEVDSFPEAFKR